MRTGKLRIFDAGRWFRDMLVRRSGDEPAEYFVGESGKQPTGWEPLPEHNLPDVRWNDEVRSRLEAAIARGLETASQDEDGARVSHVADAIERDNARGTSAINLERAKPSVYETNGVGQLRLHLEDERGESAELVIGALEVPRLVHAGVDAIAKKASTR